MITLKDIKNNEDAMQMINASNKALEVLGYTEHGLRHVGFVSKTAADILTALGYDERTIELAKITGFLHDIGNLVNRVNHGITGATIVIPMLIKMGMPMEEILRISTAIGNHEEQVGKPVSEIAAALIIADKVDAHRSRVHKTSFDPSDIHDRVNYAIKSNSVIIDKENMTIMYEITMDDTSCVMDFFNIYFSRMIFSQKAAEFLKCDFILKINGMQMNLKSNKNNI
jgi:HD superfamily phosphodiesterase